LKTKFLAVTIIRSLRHGAKAFGTAGETPGVRWRCGRIQVQGAFRAAHGKFHTLNAVHDPALFDALAAANQAPPSQAGRNSRERVSRERVSIMAASIYGHVRRRD